MEDRVKCIEKALDHFLPERKGSLSETVTDAMRYSLLNGGKRVRAVLTLAFCELCGGSAMDALPFAAAVEMVHTYSLIHDDLPCMDNDDYRRGKLTTHKKFGEDFGVLAGDGLLNYAYELLFNGISEVTEPDDLIRCVKAAKVIAYKAGIYGMVGGQSLDVWLTDKPMNEAQLEFIFNLKTGALMEAAFMAGAILAGADDRTVEKMEKAGNLIGVAFQIQDDILDVTSTQEVLGKPVLSDEKNHKTTYVTLYGMEKAEKDVVEMSNEALRLIEETGENEFLDELVRRLIHREK